MTNSPLVKFCYTPLEKRKSSDLLIIPFWCDGGKAVAAAKKAPALDSVTAALASGDFKGKESELLLLYPTDASNGMRIALLGLGEAKDASVERLRRAFCCLTKKSQEKSLTKISVIPPTHELLDEESISYGIIEGILFGNYIFDRYKTEKTIKPLASVDLLGVSPTTVALVAKLLPVFKGVYLARDLVNGCADDVTPEHLAEVAKDIASNAPRMKARIMNRKQLEKEKLGLLLAVGRGSHSEPHMIIIEYKGTKEQKACTVLVGKGVTYDTGGLNLKPTGSMETMRCDMGGAATVLGVMQALAELQLPINVTAVIPTVENCIDAASYKPGDIYTGYAGVSVEIANTDAEGRLILADAIAYAVKNLAPARILDYATLTGAMVVALGEETTGMMSNDDELANAFTRAGLSTFERVWRLPIYEEYADALKSDVADMKNVGDRTAGAIAAALFLHKFVGSTPWAHFDIAGTAFLSKERRYQPKGATGVGVRATVEYLYSLA